MAGDNNVTFYGGPCNGTTTSRTDAQLASGVLTCGGVEYVIRGTAPHMYIATVLDQQVGSSGTAATFAPDLFRAYGNLRRAIVTRLRPAVTKAQRYDAIALQSLAHRPKVRGKKR